MNYVNICDMLQPKLTSDCRLRICNAIVENCEADIKQAC
jgi:hypothetical protein